MSYYFVEVTVKVDCYEKISLNLVNAKDESAAKKIALENECHDIDSCLFYPDYVEEDGMFYSIGKCTPVSDEDAIVLRKYF